MFIVRPVPAVHLNDLAAANKQFGRLLFNSPSSPKTRELRARHDALQAKLQHTDPDLKKNHS